MKRTNITLTREQADVALEAITGEIERMRERVAYPTSSVAREIHRLLLEQLRDLEDHLISATADHDEPLPR